MPEFQSETIIARPIAEVFDFFCDPANVVRVTPPNWKMRLVESPERLQLGARLVVEVGRWGLPQRIASEVTAFERNVMFVDTQREGPFQKWIHTHRFEAAPNGTRVIDTVEFEPPRGMLGFVVTARAIERELKEVFAYRGPKLRELLESTQPPGLSR